MTLKVLPTIIVLLLSSTAFANTFYLDPVNGNLSNVGTESSPWSSLSEVVSANFISTKQYSPLPYDASSQLVIKNPDGAVQGGDTLVLMNGLHGAMFLRNYINDLAITVIAAEGQVPVLESIHLQACKNWIFEGVHVSSEPYGYYLNDRLFFIESHGWQGPSSHVTVKDCQIYSSIDPFATAQEWLDKVSSGLYVEADSCLIFRNKISNIDMGLTCQGDYIKAEENEIINFSGDGGRILGSHISFNYNLIKENYKVDDNHDDGIQSFTTNGFIVDHNEVIGNTIINTEDDSRNLLGPLQGLACFDGFYNDWFVANNVISVNHWHGITFLGANRCTIIHNTVVDPTPNVTPGGSWIRIDDHKDGTPSTDCLVVNNVANKFNVDGSEFNNHILDSQNLYNQHFSDFTSYDFNLIQGSTLIDAADTNHTIAFDHFRNDRDAEPDIGAVEFLAPTSVESALLSVENFVVKPNPFKDHLIIYGLPSSSIVKIFDEQAQLILFGDLDYINRNLEKLISGIYFFVILEESKIKVAKAFKF